MQTATIFSLPAATRNMTTNALQAEIPTELMMAESSDIAQVGTDTFHFQTLTNRISCGSVPPEYVCFPP